MPRLCRAPIAVGLLAVAALTVTIRAATVPPPDSTSTLQRFLAVDDQAPTEYRALRRLEAHSEKYDRYAWMNVWTEVDRSGVFHYEVASQGGSEYIRDHVMLATLETERRMSADHGPDRAAFTPANYAFEDRGASGDGLVALGLKPKRKDVMLVDGALFVRPGDGELVRIEGALAKPPSFWTRRVEIVRWYQRIAGVRLPVAVESTATLRIAGTATFRMQYDYESVNGSHVGSPQPW